jgi:outer membrane receptor protein involved in Fe transport
VRGSRWALALGVVGSASGASFAARADDTGDLQGLLSETYVSGASKVTESNATAPAISSTLTSDDLRRYGIHSLDEAIDFLSLGAFTSSNTGNLDIGADGVIIPNDQGDHFLLLINGHAMNEALFGAARFNRGAGIPMEMVDHIEVILGPGSVLYGSSAMLGVINVVTKDSRAFQGTHLVAESEIPTSWRVSGGGGYEFSALGQPAKLAFQLEYYQQDGPTFTVGPQAYGVNSYTNTPFDFGSGPTGIWGGQASQSYYSRVPSGLLTFHLGDLELDVHASTYKRASPFNADFVSPEANFNDPNDYRIDRSISGDLKYRIGLSAVTEIRSRLYADSFDYRRYADFQSITEDCAYNVPTCRKVEFGASRWVGLEEQASFDWLKDASLVTLLGVDGRLRWMLSQYDTLDAANGDALASSDGLLRAHDQIFAAYAQQTWNPTSWLGLNAGARFDYDPRFDPHVSPRVAASVRTWRDATFKATYSEAFRAPSWEESSVSVEDQIPAVNLKPETVRSAQVAFDQRFGSHRLLFAVFRAWWTDMVELHELTQTELGQAEADHMASISDQTAYQYRNVAAIDDYGFNAGYEGAFAQSRLRCAFNVTAAYAHTSTNGVETPLPLAPHLYGNARVSYALPGDWPTIALVGRLLGERAVDQAANFVGMPYASPLGELRATLSGAVPWVHGLSYRASADWVSTNLGAYVIGPYQSGAGIAQPANQRAWPKSPELNPIDTFRTTAGLQFDF